jgi:hypothetical protein
LALTSQGIGSSLQSAFSVVIATMENKMTNEQKGLRFAATVTMGFGVLTALAALPQLAAPTVMLTDILLWPMDGAETGALPEVRLLYAIAGGVLTGWGLMIWQLAGAFMDRAPDLTRQLIRQSVLLWFAVDSTGSVLAGAPWNVPANCIFLAMFLIPMVRGRAAQSA